MTVRSFGEALPECGRPGNRVIDKLLRARPISEEERLDLSVYIATMLKRVPHRRKKAYALIPATVEDTKQKLPHRLAELAARRGLPLADPEQALTEANSVVEGILTSVPKPIEDYIRTPWPSENMVMAIFTMNWLVIKAPPTGFFFTSDNPAVLPEVVGIDKFRETGPEKLAGVLPLQLDATTRYRLPVGLTRCACRALQSP